MGSQATRLTIINNTLHSMGVKVSEIDNYDWDGVSRPDHNFQDVTIGPWTMREEREELNTNATGCAFRMSLAFSNGHEISFRAMQSVARRLEYQREEASPPLEGRHRAEYVLSEWCGGGKHVISIAPLNHDLEPLVRWFQDRTGTAWYRLFCPEGDVCSRDGNAILSRYPFRNSGVMRFPTQDGYGGRNAVYADLSVAGQAVRIYSAHMECSAGGAVQKTQLAELMAHAKQAGGDLSVLGGDFNLYAPGDIRALAPATWVVPHMHPFELARDGFCSVFEGHYGTTCIYRSPVVPNGQLDHMLSSSKRFAAPRIGDSRGASDHSPIWAEFPLENGNDRLLIMSFNIDKNGMGGDGEAEAGLVPLLQLFKDEVVPTPDVLLLQEALDHQIIAESQSRNCRLIFQRDGNLVLRSVPTNEPLWNSKTAGRGARWTLQSDGNFVLYSQDGTAVGYSGTKDAVAPVVTEDGIFQLRRADGSICWTHKDWTYR